MSFDLFGYSILALPCARAALPPCPLPLPSGRGPCGRWNDGRRSPGSARNPGPISRGSARDPLVGRKADQTLRLCCGHATHLTHRTVPRGTGRFMVASCGMLSPAFPIRVVPRGMTPQRKGAIVFRKGRNKTLGLTPKGKRVPHVDPPGLARTLTATTPRATSDTARLRAVAGAAFSTHPAFATATLNRAGWP